MILRGAVGGSLWPQASWFTTTPEMLAASKPGAVAVTTYVPAGSRSLCAELYRQVSLGDSCETFGPSRGMLAPGVEEALTVALQMKAPVSASTTDTSNATGPPKEQCASEQCTHSAASANATTPALRA